MKKVIVIVVFSFSVIAGGVVWFLSPGAEINIQETFMIIGLVLVIGFALFQAIRRLKDARANLPTEDEMSKQILSRGAATSFNLSLYMWLAIMMFEGMIKLDRSTTIGVGILGMAVIFSLSWIYHRYIRRTHE